jgi:predicted ATPase
LRGRRTLLVLDNFEHLLSGIDLLVDLLRTAPGVRLVATSRARLNLRGEQVFALGGMDYPDLGTGMSVGEDVRRYSSVALFLRCARRALSGFELRVQDLPSVVRICQLAQGMPLAILLAAAWVPALTPAEIADEMEHSLDFLAADWRDEPARHHSMRAVFDATWRMLGEEERKVFARLSVFRGGFTRQAAQEVAGADLSMLISLVHKSLLGRDRTGRYQVHELLCQYAALKLGEMPDEKERALDRHCAYYATLAAANEAALAALREETVRVELGNVRAAWDRAVDAFDIPHMSEMVGGLDYLYYNQGIVHEALTCFGRGVEALQARGTEALSRQERALLGDLFRGLAFYEALADQLGRADAYLRQAEQIFRGLGDGHKIVRVLVSRALHYLVRDEVEMAQILSDALRLATETQDEQLVGNALGCLAAYAIRRGEYAEAARHCQQVLEIGERLDDRRLVAWNHWLLGHVASLEGAYAQARRHYQVSFPSFSANATMSAQHHEWLGRLALAQGDLSSARDHYQQALSTHRECDILWSRSLSGTCWGIGPCLVRLGDVALGLGEEGEARARYAEAMRIGLEHGHPELILDALTDWATLFARRDGSSLQRAVELAALAATHPRSVLQVKKRAEDLLQSLQERLPPDAFQAARDRGCGRDPKVVARELMLGAST